MRISTIAFLTALSLAGPVGCGGEGAYAPDPSQLPDDKVQSVSYPAGPYGTTVGAVMEDVQFASAMYDPAYLCKAGNEHRLADGQDAQAISMGQMFRGSQWCTDKPVQLVWIALTTGW